MEILKERRGDRYLCGGNDRFAFDTWGNGPLGGADGGGKMDPVPTTRRRRALSRGRDPFAVSYSSKNRLPLIVAIKERERERDEGAHLSFLVPWPLSTSLTGGDPLLSLSVSVKPIARSNYAYRWVLSTWVRAPFKVPKKIRTKTREEIDGRRGRDLEGLLASLEYHF